MTANQKNIMQILFAGGTIAKVGNAYRVRDANVIVLLKCYYGTIHSLREYIISKDGLLVLSRSKVRRLRKNTWVKREYLKFIKNQHEEAGLS
jgi:hypothetical protein